MGIDAEIVNGFGRCESYENCRSEIRRFASTKL